MIFIWRNDDNVWPHGLIAISGSIVEDARSRLKDTDFNVETQIRIRCEDPVAIIK